MDSVGLDSGGFGGIGLDSNGVGGRDDGVGSADLDNVGLGSTGFDSIVNDGKGVSLGSVGVGVGLDGIGMGCRDVGIGSVGLHGVGMDSIGLDSIGVGGNDAGLGSVGSGSAELDRHRQHGHPLCRRGRLRWYTDGGEHGHSCYVRGPLCHLRMSCLHACSQVFGLYLVLAREANDLSYEGDGCKMNEYDWALSDKHGFQERAALEEYEEEEPYFDCSVGRVRSSYVCEDDSYLYLPMMVRREARTRSGSCCSF